ncbi:hypothetical protein Adt_42129 [Abeliophyllum distichum]|uniref:Uncharacterized protein n=1 Tax=Abeliophyllum distichum TaxID=126358 RepID=A0ABD1PQT8_9LAMI
MIRTATRTEACGFAQKRDMLLGFYYTYCMHPLYSLEQYLDLLDCIIEMLWEIHHNIRDKVKIQRLYETVPEPWALVINEIVQWSDDELSYENETSRNLRRNFKKTITLSFNTSLRATKSRLDNGLLAKCFSRVLKESLLVPILESSEQGMLEEDPEEDPEEIED